MVHVVEMALEAAKRNRDMVLIGAMQQRAAEQSMQQHIVGQVMQGPKPRFQ